MAVLLYTAEQLINTIRTRGGLNSVNASGTTDADILKTINESLYTVMIPGLMKTKEEFFVVTRRFPFVSGQSRYRLPTRAVGQKIDIVWGVDNSNRYLLTHSSRTRLGNFSNSGTPNWFVLGGNHIEIYPTGSGISEIEVSWFFRPGQLVMSSEVRIVSSVDAANKVVTTTQDLPESWSSQNKFDVHSPNSGAEIKQYDLTRSSTQNNTITFSETIDGTVFGSDAIEPGDYLCLAGEAGIPAIPLEFHPTLAQAATVMVLEGQGSIEEAAYHQQKLDRMLGAAGYLVSNRVQKSKRHINARNSLYRAG